MQLAISYLFNGKNKKFWIFTLLACLTHISSVILIVMYVIFKKTNDNKHHILFFLILYIVLLFSFVFFVPLLKFITSTGILPSKYTFDYFYRFINENNNIDKLGVGFKSFFCLLTALAASKNTIKQKINNFNFLFHVVFIDMILWNYDIYIQHFDRISFYFGYTYLIFLLPSFYTFFADKKIGKLIYYALLIILFFIYWYIRFIYQNAGEVYPYISYWEM